MYLGSMVKPGDFLVPVPVGIPITLQYGFSGILEKVYRRFGDDRVEETEAFLKPIKSLLKAPSKLHTKGGITLVRGILYSNYVCPKTCRLPYGVEDDLRKQFIDSPGSFNFFAATWDNGDIPVYGASQTRQLLSMSKFKLLDGWVVTPNLSKPIVRSWVSNPSYPFTQSAIGNYIVFRGDDEPRYFNSGYRQMLVNDLVKYVDDSGYIQVKLVSEVKDDEGLSNTYINYREVVINNIQRNMLVTMDDENEIVLCKYFGKGNPGKVSDTISCTYCGKQIIVTVNSDTICPDDHCASKLYSRIRQFTNILKISIPESEDIRNQISSKEITCIGDIFCTGWFEKSGMTVSTSYAKLLRALIPVTVIRNDEVIKQFADKCVNNKDMFLYYCEHPSAAPTDLGINHKDFKILSEWLKDDFNFADVRTLLETPYIIFNETGLKYDAAPIFRNKVICLTGDFIRGSLEDVSRILANYGADIVTELRGPVNAVIVGGMRENINGPLVASAKSQHIEIFEEEDFFIKYDIDKDIKNNLS